MPTVTITFDGAPGTGKTILSNSIKNHLGNLGFKVRQFPSVDSDTLKVETTKKHLERAVKPVYKK